MQALTVIKPGDPAPELKIASWVQGEPVTFAQLRDKIVIVEVFQVNCPGCFLYGLPEAIELFVKYRHRGVFVVGLATAFEDFDKNNLENLQKLIAKGEVIGETLSAMQANDWTDGNRLRYKIPFPVAMDRLTPASYDRVDDQIEFIITRDITDFERLSYGEQTRIRESIRKYLAERHHVAETFDLYNMSGTPTSLVIDRKGVLRHQIFGQSGKLDKIVRALLAE